MEPTFLSATRLAELTRSGQIGCLELLDHFITRIERHDCRINAVVVRDFERARERARELDGQKDRSAPLFGVPMTVKESFDVAGLPSTRGHPAAKERSATVSSLAVRRLEAAGAVVFGKTNVPVDLADWQSYNPVYGAPPIPGTSRTRPAVPPGDRAAALAAGLSGAGDRQRHRRLDPRAGALLRRIRAQADLGRCARNSGDPATSAAPATDIAVIGPLARSAHDLALALDAIAAPDPDELGSASLPPARVTRLQGLRVAVWANRGPGDRQRDGGEAARARRFSGARGAAVSRTARPGFDAAEAYRLYLQLLDAAWSAMATDASLADAA